MHNQSQQLQIGHIVHLNSGSPDLKVVGFKGGEVEVEWLNDQGNLDQMTAPAVCFTRVISN
jgi:uncharacterized protein YodC (DUF2158 family)